jgi:hypothetical protein
MNVNINKDIQKITTSILKTTTEVLSNAKVKTTMQEAKKKFKVTLNNKELNVSIPGYYTYVDKGRKKGKRPPIKPIIDWVKRNKLEIPDGSSVESIAFAVANSIANDGLKPRPFIEELQLEIGMQTRNYLVNVMNKELKKGIKRK